MQRVLLGICLWMFAGPALAEPALTAQELLDRGLKWQELGEPQQAIETFEQSYLERRNPLCLYYMALNHERLADIPTRSIPEVLYSKRRALDLYERFIGNATAGQDPRQVEQARERIEPLRHEIEQLSPHALLEQRLSAQRIDALLLGQKVMLDKLDAIHGLLMQIAKEMARAHPAKR